MALVRILLHGRGRGSIQFGQDLEQPVDLAVGADADAETCRIARIAHQANENPALLELLESLPGGRASGRPDEVGLAVRYSVAEVAQGCRQPTAGGQDLGASHAQMLLVLERGGARHQAEGVAVVRVLDLEELIHYRGLGDQVSQANSGEAVALAERSCDDDVGVVANQGDAMLLGKVGVSLVNDQRTRKRPREL